MGTSAAPGSSEPPPLGSAKANLLRRREQLIALLWFTTAAWGVYVFLNGAMGRPLSAGVNFSAAFAAFITALITKRAPLSWQRGLEHTNVIITTVALVFASALSGGLEGMAIWYLAAIPIFTAYQMDVKATLFWSIVSVASGVALARNLVPIPVEFVPDAAEITFGLAVLVLTTGGIAMISRRILDQHAASLEAALTDVERLRGLLPICAGCKSIRDDQGYWHVVESYLESHAHVEFTHGLCPDCVKRYYDDGTETDREEDDQSVAVS